MGSQASYMGLKVSDKTINGILEMENAKGAARNFMQRQMNMRDLKQFYNDKASEQINGSKGGGGGFMRVLNMIGQVLKSIGPMMGMMSGGGGLMGLLGLLAI